MQEGGGDRDTNVYDFFVLLCPYVCLWLLSPCHKLFQIFYFQPSREDSRDMFLEAIAKHEGFLISPM